MFVSVLATKSTWHVVSTLNLHTETNILSIILLLVTTINLL